MKSNTTAGFKICVCLVLLTVNVKAQTADTLQCSPRRQWMNNIFQQAWNSIHRDPKDICGESPNDVVLNAKSEDIFKPYSGKIIRNIVISQLDFGQNFTDTSSSIKNLINRAANRLHYKSRDFVIRNNLFFKEDQELNPYIISDNERYLRTLSFLQDARIVVMEVSGSNDSVDLHVITKDLFTLKADASNNNLTGAKVNITEGNLMGMGQQLRLTGMGDVHRDPFFGYGVLYTKTNLCGSFINTSVGFNNVNDARRIGLEQEAAYYFRMERPLYSPYSHFAGALEISSNHSINTYQKPDSFFTHYAYNNYDGWAGYNFCVNHMLQHDSNQRSHKFFALRYQQQHFSILPEHFSDHFDPVYNNKQSLLAQMTFFKQNFIKTQYVYGFGITEDVPYGYNVSLTGGWYKQLNLQRPYAGISIDYYTAKKEGSFCQYYLRAGSFKSNERMEDATLLLGASYFSKLFFAGTDFKIRQSVRATYSRLFNRVIYTPLQLDNSNGLQYFGGDSVMGNERISLQTETSFFIRYHVLGFRFAPFVNGQIALLRNDELAFSKSDIYPGIGGGLRTRNENLIFKTIEIKGIWFPRPVRGLTPFQIRLTVDLQFKYNTNYITPPDIIQLNSGV